MRLSGARAQIEMSGGAEDIGTPSDVEPLPVAALPTSHVLPSIFRLSKVTEKMTSVAKEGVVPIKRAIMTEINLEIMTQIHG